MLLVVSCRSLVDCLAAPQRIPKVAQKIWKVKGCGKVAQHSLYYATFVGDIYKMEELFNTAVLFLAGLAGAVAALIIA